MSTTTDALAEALETLRTLLNKAHTVGQDDYREGAGDASVKRHYDEMRAAETNHRTALFALAQHDAAQRSAHLDAPHNSSAQSDAEKPASSGAQSEDSARLTKLDRMITEDCGYEITLRWDNSQDVMSISDHHGNVWGEAYPPDESEDEEGMGLALRAAIDSIRDHRPIRAARAAQGKGGAS